MATKQKTLKEVRYLETSDVPSRGQAPYASADGAYLLPRDIHRMGERIGCLLESEGFTLGTFDHLFIALTPALPAGSALPVGVGFYPWMGLAAYGLPATFRDLTDQEKIMQLQAATFHVLRIFKPQHQGLLNSLEQRLLSTGTRTKVLRASKETQPLSVQVWFDVPPLGEKAHIFVVANEKNTGRRLEAPPFPLAEYDHVFPLVSAITISKGAVNLVPRKSLRAELSTRNYGVPLRFPLSTFTPVSIDDV